MNSVAIGITVALAAAIGLWLVAPGASGTEFALTAMFYGLLAGFLVELWKFAADAMRKPPFGR